MQTRHSELCTTYSITRAVSVFGAVVLWCAVYDDGCMVCPRAHCCFRVYAHVMPSPSDVSDTHQH